MDYVVTDEPCRAFLPVSRALAIPSLSSAYDGGSSSACWTSKKQFQHHSSSSSSTDPGASCRAAPTGFRHVTHMPPSRSAASSSDSSVIVSSAGPSGVVTKLRTPHMVPQDSVLRTHSRKNARKWCVRPPTRCARPFAFLCATAVPSTCSSTLRSSSSYNLDPPQRRTGHRRPPWPGRQACHSRGNDPSHGAADQGQ